MTDAWMTMIFRHGFFHGDPHPANIMLLDDGRIGLVDFGLAGKLTDEDMTRLTRLFVDAATENVDALPRRLSELGLRYPKEREEELRDAIEELYYRYYGASVSSIDPIEVIREGLDLIYSLNLRLPTRFVILDKAIATLGAVGRRALSRLQRLRGGDAVRAQADRGAVLAPADVAARCRARCASSPASRASCPTRCATSSSRRARAGSRCRSATPASTSSTYHIDHAVNRIAVALIVLGGLVGSSILGVLATSGPHVVGLHLISFVGFMISGIFGVWLVWGIARSGRL